MKKIESDYIEEYGNIPRNDDKRFSELIHNMNFKRNNKITEIIHNIINIPWKKINYIIYLVPKATPRPRHNLFTNTFYVSGAKDNKELFKKFISKQDIDMIITPCKFTCVSYLPIPKSMNNIDVLLAEMGLIRPISKPDFDNLAKTYADMIQGTLLYDDALIIEGVSKKFYSTKPRIEIHIEYMTEFDCKYNQKKIRKKCD